MTRTATARWPGTPAELETVVRRAADAITVQGPDGALLFANDAAAATMGFADADELLRTPLAQVLDRFELVDDAGAPLPLSALPSRRALAGEAGPPTVVRFRVRATGQERWSLVQATPIRGDDGSVRMVINTFQDITELKLTEQRLRLLADVGAVLGQSVDYEATLRELAELVVPALADWCVVDVADGAQPRRVAVAHVDPAKRELAAEIERRYPPDSTRGGGASQVIASGEPIVMAQVPHEVLAQVAVDEDHLRLLEEAEIGSVVILPLVARGQVLGAMTMVRAPGAAPYGEADLPLVEELARRAALSIDNARLLEEANEAVRLRDDFLAMASHDMRTPLAVILANIQLARRKLADGRDGREALRHLEAAERTTQKMTGLVGELMDVTILRTGQALPLSRERVDLSAVVHGFAEEYRRLSDVHSVQVDAPDDVQGEWDGTRIERVMRNLLDNALKYSPGGGVVRIGVREEVREDGARCAAISVTDEGVGIPDDELPLLFEKYHRGSNTRELRGTGLGLAGSRRVIEQLGGTIEVESRLGVGSTFTVYLPLDT